MKKIFRQISILGITAVLLNACKPDNDFMVGQPANRVEQLTGTWKLETVTQTDLLAQNYNYADPSRPTVDLVKQDITVAAPFTDIALTLVSDAVAPTTFSVNYGAGPKIFKLTSGNWKVDDILAPGKIQLINGTDTTNTIIGGVNNLSAGILSLQLTKYQGTKAVTRYNYNFKKN